MIEGKRIRLVPLEKKDLEEMHLIRNDPEVLRCLWKFIPKSLEDEYEWFEIQRKDRSTMSFAVRTLKDDKLVGQVNLINIDYHYGHCEFTIFIGRQFFEAGLGTEATSLALSYAFNELAMQKVYLSVFDFNTRAQKVYTKLGFKEEGRLRRHIFRAGKYHDSIMMSMLREEWQERNSAPEPAT
jgi:RimJ/RimL family protein N-acetyltransferase